METLIDSKFFCEFSRFDAAEFYRILERRIRISRLIGSLIGQRGKISRPWNRFYFEVGNADRALQFSIVFSPDPDRILATHVRYVP